MVQIGLRIQAIGFGRFQHTENSGAGVGPGLSIAEQPILPADDNRADGVLHLVVADLDLTVVEERAKERWCLRIAGKESTNCITASKSLFG